MAVEKDVEVNAQARESLKKDGGVAQQSGNRLYAFLSSANGCKNFRTISNDDFPSLSDVARF